MDTREAIKQLEFDISMILFDPSTGETLTEEEVKCRNEMNYKTLLALEIAIANLKAIPYHEYRPEFKNMTPKMAIGELVRMPAVMIEKPGATKKAALEMAISALRLRIKKEPIDNTMEFGDTVVCCPNCGKSVINYWNRKINPPHCMMCGQKLRWEDEQS